MAATALAQDKVWIEKSTYNKAECQYFERLAKVCNIYYVYLIIFLYVEKN